MKDYGADEIERDVAQQGEVLDCSPIANPAMVLIEGDIKHPVQTLPRTWWRSGEHALSLFTRGSDIEGVSHEIITDRFNSRL